MINQLFNKTKRNAGKIIKNFKDKNSFRFSRLKSMEIKWVNESGWNLWAHFISFDFKF